MAGIGQIGSRLAGSGRLRRRRWVLAVTAAALVAGMVAALPASADDDDSFGKAQFTLHSGWEVGIEYGQDLLVYGMVADESQSCLTFPLSCDRPEGTMTFSGVNHTIDYGQTTLVWNHDDPSASFANFEHTIPAAKFDPGIRYVVIEYAGNFDPFLTYIKVTVTRQACHSFQLFQSSAGSKPGEPVTLTADLGPVAPGIAGHTGTLTIYDQSGGIIATGAPTDGRYLSTVTSAMPQGSSSYYATYSGDGLYEGCTSGYADHEVSTDAIPTANDDFASTSSDEPVSIPVLANDFDDNPGIRPEITNNPDFGDFEKIGNSYLYTPDPDMGNYQDSFDYIDYDSIGQSSAEAHVVVTVGCTPNARDDRYGTRAYTPLDVTSASGRGVLRNDDTCDSPVTVATPPAHGDLDLATDGSFRYVPDDGYDGTDSFTYQYTDGLEVPVTGRVDLEVTPLQAPPSPLPPLEGTTTTTTTTTTEPPSSTTTTTEAPTSTTSSTTTTTEAPTTTSTTSEPPTSTTSTSTTTSTTEPPTSTTSTSTTSTTSTTVPPTSTTTTTTPPPTTGEVTVASLYDLLLGRTPDPNGAAHWVPKIDGGGSPEVIARSLVDSAEFRRRMVRQAYEACLGRQPDAAGLAYWADRLADEGPDRLRTELLASNESWNRAGADPAAWTDQVFQALLGRDATVGEHQVIDPAIEGGTRRTFAAGQVVAFTDARRHLAAVWYPALLERAPTSTEADAWAAAMAAGRSERSLIAQLAASAASASG